MLLRSSPSEGRLPNRLFRSFLSGRLMMKNRSTLNFDLMKRPSPPCRSVKTF